MKKRIMSTILLIALIICIIPTQIALASNENGKWVKDSNGWKYEYDEGFFIRNEFYTINNKTYYFDENYYMVIGWREIWNDWYYFKSNGEQVKGWKQIKNKWYYFNPNNYGKAEINSFITINGKKYYSNDKGHMVIGWQKINGLWYYFNINGNAVTGWQKINNKWYYFSKKDFYDDYSEDSWNKYSMLIGFQQIDNKYYYLLENGNNKVGWQKVKTINEWTNETTYDYYYYKSVKGEVAIDEVIQNYYVDNKGKWNGCSYSWKKQIVTSSMYEFSTWKWTYVDSTNHIAPNMSTMLDEPILAKINNKYYCFYDGLLLTNVYVETDGLINGYIDKIGYYWVNFNGVCINPNNLLKQYTGDYVTSNKYFGYYKDSNGYIPKNCTLKMIHTKSYGGVWGLGPMGDIVKFDKNGTPKCIGDFSWSLGYERYY